MLRCPRSVVILHDVERLPSPYEGGGGVGSVGGLVALERFFEEGAVEAPEGVVDPKAARGATSGRGFGGRGGAPPQLVDLTQCVFILTSEVGKGALRGAGVAASSFSAASAAAALAATAGGKAHDSGAGGGGGAGVPREQLRYPRTTGWVLEVVKVATREWTAGRPALGGRLSTSQVPFV